MNTFGRLVAIVAFLPVTAMAGTVSPFVGHWRAFFNGYHTGHCELRILDSGHLTGTCKAKGEPAFKVSGQAEGAAPNGTIHFGAGDIRFSGGTASPRRFIGNWKKNGKFYGDWYLRRICR